ncbi:MAG: arginine N-succinyltransferase [Parachlamydiaceae bacterium]|nr:arginine N-succinyltransferase [Parachlamydiaceae bacterium]
MIVRPVSIKDLDATERCANAASAGIINLPKQRDILEQHIRDSEKAFAKTVHAPGDEDYLFVLSAGPEIMGTSGIYANIGETHPFFVYHVESTEFASFLPNPSDLRLLTPMRYPADSSELCALYLLPQLRSGGYGKLLSLTRLLFMASFPERFADTTIANLRGWMDQQYSPFWEGLGKRLAPIEFDDIMNRRAVSEQFVSDILPRYPVYAALLPSDAQQAIGQPHVNAKPAMQILFQQGFTATKDIDPIDGGPILTAVTQQITTIAQSNTATVKDITKTLLSTERYIISNSRLDFRAHYGSLQFTKEDEVTISAETATALNVTLMDTIRYIRG